jgi:large subunit ribosomal protein L4
MALYSALATRVRDGELVIVDDLNFEAPKTKQMITILKALGITGGSCLIILPKADEVVWKSARNIPYVKVATCAGLNAYEILKPKRILLTREALSNIR